MNTYKIVIFGANGRTGLELVKQALEMGHFVTAVVRNPDTFALAHKNLFVHKGDVKDVSSFQDALQGHDAVISALGAASKEPTTVLSVGVRNIQIAMDAHCISRLIIVSALAVETNPTMAWWMKVFIKRVLQPILKNLYDDILRMEYMIKQTNLNWTIVRPPQLTDKKVTGRYRVAINDDLPGAAKISRADLAHYMLHHVKAENTYKATIELGY